jgi:hypothetical protein
MRFTRTWSDDDLKKLEELSKTNITWREVAKQLGRSDIACRKCALRYGFTSAEVQRRKYGGHLHRWSKEEDAYVLKNYTYAARIKIGKALGRSPSSITTRWSLLSRGVRRRFSHWTREEEVILRSLWSDTKRRVIKAALKPRTWEAIRRHALELGIANQRFQGYELFQYTAKRLGISHTGLRSLIANMGVKARREVRYLYIEIEAIDNALIEWDRRETLKDGAKRLHIDAKTLTKLLKQEGAHPGYRKTRRYPPELLDQLVSAYRKGIQHVQSVRSE